MHELVPMCDLPFLGFNTDICHGLIINEHYTRRGNTVSTDFHNNRIGITFCCKVCSLFHQALLILLYYLLCSRNKLFQFPFLGFLELVF